MPSKGKIAVLMALIISVSALTMSIAIGTLKLIASIMVGGMMA